MTLGFKHASIVDGIRFTAQIGVPNVVLGLFRKRALPAQVAAEAHADDLAYLLVGAWCAAYGPDPFWIRVAREEALLVHHPDDIRIVLGGSPDPFASDPDTKRKGMAAFQPDALTISRGELWRDAPRVRRVRARHRLAGAPAGRVVPRASSGEEARRLAAGGPMKWDELNACFARITRRVVFGDAAADDTSVTAELGAA